MKINSDNILTDIIQSCRQAFWYIGIFSFFVNVLMLTVPLYMLQLFDRVLASFSSATLIYLTLVAIVALVVFGLLDIARSRIVLHISNWLDKYLSPAALSRSADEVLQGRVYGAQSLRDIKTIRGFLVGIGIFALFDSVWVPVYLLVIYLLHPLLGVLATVAAILLFSLALLNELTTHKIIAKATQESLNTQAHIDSALRNAEVIQAMGMMPNVIKHWKTKNAPAMQLQTKANQRGGFFTSSSKFLRLGSQLFMLGLGAYLVIQNAITPGVMIAAAILMSRALAPVEQSISVWKQMVGSYQAFLRLKKHFATPHIRNAGIALPKPKGRLDLEEVVYVPPGAKKPVILGISLHIPPGSLVALIGPTGAGKSTLARLIVGAWKPSGGKVRLDNADVYTWDRADFGSHTGYLPQDVELFIGSVKENIARMGEIDDKAIIAAAKAAGVHEFILHLPSGYDTQIMTGQFNLSGGQRQRIALARALYKEPTLIVLDEPNAHLDRAGEMALVKALMDMKKKGSTQIIITHKPNLLEIVDYIVVLKDGKIQFLGPRDEVLTKMRQAAGRV